MTIELLSIKTGFCFSSGRPAVHQTFKVYTSTFSPLYHAVSAHWHFQFGASTTLVLGKVGGSPGHGHGVDVVPESGERDMHEYPHVAPGPGPADSIIAPVWPSLHGALKTSVNWAWARLHRRRRRQDYMQS